MSRGRSDADDATRRSILKTAGAAVTGLALGAGVAAGDDGDTDSCYWDYRCTSYQCNDGSGYQEQKRYCCDGECTHWENAGCC